MSYIFFSSFRFRFSFYDSRLVPQSGCFILTLIVLIRIIMAASASPSTGSQKLDAVVETTKANAPQKLSGINLYSRFALAGAVCCSVTHGGLTPVDVYVRMLSGSLALR